MALARARHWISMAGVLILAAACADLKAMMALSLALQKQYGVEAAVKVTNETHLTITFDELPDAIAKAAGDSAARSQFARDVAGFTKANYANAARLQDITIAFSHVRSLGAVTITHTEAPYTFAMRDIPSQAASAAPPDSTR